MADRDPRDIDWRRVFAEAIAIALEVTSYPAEDVVQEGMKLYFSGEAPWDTTGGETLAHHLVAAGVDALNKKARTERRRRHPGVVGKVVSELDRPPPTPEDDYGQAEENVHKLRLFEKVLAHFAADQEALDVLLLLQQGVSDASDQAKRTGMDITVVRNARKRIRRYAEDLAKQDEQAVGS
jgi:hypothetical protein